MIPLTVPLSDQIADDLSVGDDLDRLAGPVGEGGLGVDPELMIERRHEVLGPEGLAAGILAARRWMSRSRGRRGSRRRRSERSSPGPSGRGRAPGRSPARPSCSCAASGRTRPSRSPSWNPAGRGGRGPRSASRRPHRGSVARDASPYRGWSGNPSRRRSGSRTARPPRRAGGPAGCSAPTGVASSDRGAAGPPGSGRRPAAPTGPSTSENASCSKRSRPAPSPVVSRARRACSKAPIRLRRPSSRGASTPAGKERLGTWYFSEAGLPSAMNGL